MAVAVVLAAGLGGAAAAQQDGGRLAAISDIHFDPFATQGLPQRLLAAAPGSAGSIGGPWCGGWPGWARWPRSR
jgi:hypothetical protein